MKKIIPFLHLFVIIGVLSTPFWLSWKLITIFAFLNLLQIRIFGGCILSQFQFKNKTQGFYRYYLDKFFPNNTISSRNLNIFLDWVVPMIIIFSAYFIQNY